MTRMARRIVLTATLLLASGGCRPARPVAPLAPSYPVILASAGYAGRVTVKVSVDRSGRAVVEGSEGPASGASGLFTRAAEAAVAKATWRPARRFGIARGEMVRYEVAFVLLRDTLPIAAGERVVAGNDGFPVACPLPRGPHEAIVCAMPSRVRYVESP